MGQPSGSGIPPEIVEALKSCSNEIIQTVYATLASIGSEEQDADSRAVDTWYVALGVARGTADHHKILSASLASMANILPVRDYTGYPLPTYNLKPWSELTSPEKINLLASTR